MAKSYKTCMEQAEIIDTFGTYQSFVNSKAGGIDNSSVLVGRKVICCCVQVHVNSLARSNFWRSCHLLVDPWSPTETINLSIFAKGNCCCTASHLPLGVTNEELDANLSCMSLSHPTTMGTVIVTPTARIIGRETYPAMRNL